MECFHGKSAACSTTARGTFWFCGKTPSCEFFCHDEDCYLFTRAMEACQNSGSNHPFCPTHQRLTKVRVVKDKMILATFGNGDTFTKALDHAASTGCDPLQYRYKNEDTGEIFTSTNINAKEAYEEFLKNNDPFLEPPDPDLSNPTSSSNLNTGAVIGAVVAALVVFITVIVILTRVIYRRKPRRESTGDIGNIQNAAYEGDIYTDRRLPHVPDSDSHYEEPAKYAQLDSSKRVPIDANYQSLNMELLNMEGYAQLDSSKRVPIDATYQSLETQDQMQIDRDQRENVQQYGSLNIGSKSPDVSLYEAML
ncbi:Hypothetical predicted protein [Paramuricea clavata]|uniref:Uncharacterized protein n=1 Tax=Paramuricea clavata TaxID=317549 RepID=A0A7D9DLF0_PARCT|nr:Hypothetical predicted protein [Paramuricea clavata]